MYPRPSASAEESGLAVEVKGVRERLLGDVLPMELVCNIIVVTAANKSGNDLGIGSSHVVANTNSPHGGGIIAPRISILILKALSRRWTHAGISEDIPH
jgi:hypothetical protein